MTHDKKGSKPDMAQTLADLREAIEKNKRQLEDYIHRNTKSSKAIEVGIHWCATLFDISIRHECLWEKILNPKSSEEDKVEAKRLQKKLKAAAYAAFERFPELLDLEDHFKHTVSFYEVFEDFAEEFEDQGVVDDFEEMTKRRKAREMARKAVKATHCLICGTAQGRNLHRHHYDYNQPIDVFVLCLRHHFELHAYMRDANKTFNREETVEYISKRIDMARLPDDGILRLIGQH